MELNSDFSNLSQFEASMSKELLYYWDMFQISLSEGLIYDEIQIHLDVLKPMGLTFEYGLDSEPYNYKLI